MREVFKAKWIKSGSCFDTVSPIFCKSFDVSKNVVSAVVNITAKGLYKLYINEKKVGNFELAPGWTVYNKRLQVQEYDVTSLINQGDLGPISNQIKIHAGEGWALGHLAWDNNKNIWSDSIKVLACLTITYDDGTIQSVMTDETFSCYKSNIMLSSIYDGETIDYNFCDDTDCGCVVVDDDKDALIPQEGEIIKEQETFDVKEVITTPKGEVVIDFGQNLTGYLCVPVKGKKGDVVVISHGEVLDSDGNFYNANYRKAKALITITCDGEEQVFKPAFTFFGFRYVRIDSGVSAVDIKNLKAIAVYSDIKRTSTFECSNPLLNQLYQNILWGQRGNFVDVPTDCPQRDERLGWTGDAQAFVKTATYNFDVNKFFTKWLHDVAVDQLPDGRIPHVVPNVLGADASGSAAWADAVTICPWQVYVTYDNKDILADQFDSMVKWVEYIRNVDGNEFLWENGTHFGDWLGLDAEEGSYKGSTSEELIATAFYAYSTSLLIKSGKVLGRDMSEYECLYKNIIQAFSDRYINSVDNKLVSHTQTAYVLALHFGLVQGETRVKFAKHLAKLVKQNANKLTTGFVGTPYLLHALANNGYEELAYTVLLQDEYPSWLYPVTMGATTIWEHWDGIKPDGSMWSTDMNSYNHYAYGAVCDFMFESMAGIKPDEKNAGFKHIIISPIVDRRVEYVKASIDTKYGKVKSSWKDCDGMVKYKFTIPKGTSATITVAGKSYEVTAGDYEYIS